MKIYYDNNGVRQILKPNMVDNFGRIQLNIKVLSDDDIFNLFGYYLYVEKTLKLNEYYTDLIFDEETKTCYHNIEIETIVYDLEDLRNKKNLEFSSAMNDFVLLIAKCQIIHGLNNEGLNNIIEIARNMRIKTISEIKAITTIEKMLAYQIKGEDINYMKSLFAPYCEEIN